MPKMFTNESRNKVVDPEERRKERRLTQVRDYVEKHVRFARLVGSDNEGLTKKQLLTAPLLIHARPDDEVEYIVSEKVFRDKVCDGIAWRLALKNLKTAGCLNFGVVDLVTIRVLADLSRIAEVVRINSEILQYRTAEEDQALREQQQSRCRRR
jgi:hypothetical protein